MIIKSAIKTVAPSFFLNWWRINQYKKQCKYYYDYDASRFTKYSNSINKWNNPEKLIGQIVAEYHVIEKGLTMPNMHFGFGQLVLNDLISHCDLYTFRFDKNNEQLLYAIRVIAEYKLDHERNGYELSNELLTSINSILSKYDDVVPSEQITMNKEDYFKFNHSSFEDFSNSRHSLRSFSGSIEIDTIKKSVSLAQNAPSGCNRQPSRVYVLQDKYHIEQVLNVQTGNRGFGHLANKLIVLTAELGGYLALRERNDVYVNGGIYAMNLLYALHYHQIGACSLNWCATPEQDIELRKICDIPPSEAVILIIACGSIPDKFKLAASHRSNFSNILKVI